MRTTAEQLKKAMAAAGHKLFSRGDYNLNLIGIRSNDTKANTFNDLLCVLYKQNGQDVLLQFACTTDPGTYYRENPLNVNGTAIVKPGQYKGLWQLGRHQGKYPALVQRSEITVFRDNDGNKELNLADCVEETGYFGINLHRASEQGLASQVDKFSAGCQVIQNPDDYAMLIALCRRGAELHGNSFTYTLLTQQKLEAGS
ncbi:hypothetical protein [Bowmanella denitrificans]|uniref:hypothetical protein n=1 Tax=Bowmanella denitrificans TaxID=366582 RepID=UPI000C9982FD|nr:hypothetical protein [Bowmanella denitrificans]